MIHVWRPADRHATKWATAMDSRRDGIFHPRNSCILDIKLTEASGDVMERLAGHYAELSAQKFSSNVVEKCLKLTEECLRPLQDKIVEEMAEYPHILRLLQDPYANYVVQSALSVSSGALYEKLVDKIRPYLNSLRGTPHGKRIMAKINK